MKDKISITIESPLIKEIDALVDKVIVRNRSQAIETIINNYIKKKRTAIILTDGMETQPFRTIGKIGNETIIEHNITQLKQYGFSKIIIIGKPELLKQIFELIENGKAHGTEIEYVRTAGRKSYANLLLVKDKITSATLFIPGDNIITSDLDKLMNFHFKNMGTVTLLTTGYNGHSEGDHLQVQGSTVIKYNNTNPQFKQDNNAIKTNLVWTGIMIFNPEYLENKGESNETDILPELTKKEKVKAFIDYTEWLNIHTKEDLERAIKYFK